MDLLRTTLGNRDLTRIEAAFAVAALGNWAFSILLAIYAYRQWGTGAVAVALVVRMLPSGLAALYTAMLVDRHSRRAVLVWASVPLAGAAAAAAAGTPLGVVLAFAAAFTIANTAHRPAQAALMPHLARTPAELSSA
jgi:MFS family permease